MSQLPLGALALAALAPAAAAQTIELAADLDLTPVPISSDPRGDVGDLDADATPRFVEHSGFWYFTASTVDEGRELWRTDGTAAGTTLVANVNPGGDSDPAHLTSAGGVLFFMADDGVHGRELWKTAGTPATTFLVKDIHPGPEGTDARELTAFQGALFFSSDGPTTDRHLWRSDGTSTGTGQFAQLAVGQSSDPMMLKANAADTLLYFFADDGVHGGDPWVTDGTLVGTKTLGDLDAGSPFVETGLDDNFHEVNGLMVFGAFHPTRGRELWVTDGTAAGTSFLADTRPGSQSGVFQTFDAIPFQGQLYFAGWYIGGVKTLWRTDGTTAGTVRLNTAGATPSVESSDPVAFTELGGKLYYLARKSGSPRLHVWDGTVADIAHSTLAIGFKDPYSLVGTGSALVMRAEGAFDGPELWALDGTPDAATELTDVSGFSFDTVIDFLTPIPGDRVLFCTTDAEGDRELWVTDTTPEGTGELKDLEPKLGSLGSDPQNLVSFDGRTLLFSAKGSGDVRQPWAFDPAVGAVLLGTAETELDDLFEFTPAWIADHPVTLFRMNHTSFGREAWVTDGTPAGTQLLHDGEPGPASSLPSSFFGDGHRVYFEGDATHGQAILNTGLCITDGTNAGTAGLADIEPGASSINFEPLGVLGGQLLFGARTLAEGDELWITDGTPAGTQLLHVLNPGTGGGGVRGGFPYKGKLVFSGYDGSTGSLWITDGTSAGTAAHSSLVPGPHPTNPKRFVRLGDELLFQGNATGALYHCYRTDLSAAPRPILSVWNDAIAPQDDDRLAVVGDQLYFAAEPFDGSTGIEVWRTDGTAAGTALVADIVPGTGDSRPLDFVAADAGVYFTADDGVHGRELWFADALGAQLVADLRNGPEGSDPQDLVIASGALYFSATGDFAGRELYRLTDLDSFATPLGPAVPGATLEMSPPRIGQPVTTVVRELPPGDVGFLAMSFPLPAPMVWHSQPGFPVWIDPASLNVLATLTAASPAFTTTIPNDVGLVGLDLHFQVAHSPTGAAPIATSQALAVRIGG